MQHLKDQLEQRTRMIEANIQKQQEELRQIHEQLQRVQGQGAPVHTLTHSHLHYNTFCEHRFNIHLLVLTVLLP